MIEITNTQTFGFEGAIRGMRNPMNSWDKSDSDFSDGVNLGPNDLNLAKRLINCGPSDRKFLRMIHVTMDITAPQYWWREFDTYKIATTANSSSQMHKIHSRNLTLDDFSHEHLDEKGIKALEAIIAVINDYRISYKETNDKEDWYRMIQLIPQSSHYLRTVDLNYETLISMYFSRRYHKQYEWREFCKWIETLPYMKEFLTPEEKKDDSLK